MDTLPLHGGDLETASEHYGVALEQWIDLSTGINPESYPVDSLDVASFQYLPYLKPAFIQAAKSYYLGHKNNDLDEKNLLAVSGSQAVIQLLPECLPSLPVLLPELGYQEHRMQWQQSGSQITNYPSTEHQASLTFINAAIQKNNQQHLVVINPNNPTGLRFAPAQLKLWASELGEGAYLIIDEAFVDTQPELSVIRQDFEPNMVVLRSFGKFFGLAGLRLGFAFANEKLIQSFQKRLGLWTINGPAQSIATTAFQDGVWQQWARENIVKTAEQNQALFKPLFDYLQRKHETGYDVFHEALFSSYYLPILEAEKLYGYFAKRGILFRLVPVNDCYSFVRIGHIKTSDQSGIDRVEVAVSSYLAEIKA